MDRGVNEKIIYKTVQTAQQTLVGGRNQGLRKTSRLRRANIYKEPKDAAKRYHTVLLGEEGANHCI